MSIEPNSSTEQHDLPAELRDADHTPQPPRRRSAAAIVMTVALIGALVLLAIAPFQLVAQSNTATRSPEVSEADWDRITRVIADDSGPESQRFAGAPSTIVTDGKSGIFAFAGRTSAGDIAFGAARLDGESTRTSMPAGHGPVSAIFQLPDDNRYILVWVSSPNETNVSITLNFFDDRAAAEEALRSASTALPA